MKINFQFLTLLLTLSAWGAHAQTSQWFVSMREGSYAETYDSDVVFPKTFVKENWAKDLYITEAAYGNGEWVVTCSANTGYSGQTFKMDEEFPSGWIDQKWSQGYDITNVEYGAGEWLIIMSKGAGLSGESWGKRSTLDGIKQYIKTTWNEGKDIVDIAYGNGEWVAVLAKEGTGFRHQYYLPSTSFPMNWVNDKYNEGYNVSSVTYGEGYWFVVVSKLSQQLKETFKTNSSFPSSFVSDEWNNNGMRIANMQFSYEKDLSVSFDEYYQAGMDAANDGDHEDAIFYYTEALKINDKHLFAYNNRAWSKYLIGQCQGGLADINKSLALGKNEYNTHTRGSIYMCLGRCHEALSDYDESLSLASNKEGLYYADRGSARQCLGDYKKAIEDYDKAISLDPANASTYRSSKKLCENELAKNQKPKITWDYPYNSFTSTTKSSYEIKVCIHSAASITKKEIFVNGQSFASRGFGVDDDCTESIEQSVNLKAGTNTIEIVVYTANNSARSEKRTIEYKAKSSGNYHALLIGVQSYDDFSISDLEKPVADTRRLKSVLTNDYTFNENDVHTLENPTKDEIINKLVYLQERLGKEDNLLIFYSGHGVAKDKLGYWLPSDAKKDSRSTWFSNGELRDYLYSMNTQHTLVIADACFGGTILTGGYRDITEFACTEMAKLPSCRAMTSGAGTIVPDESVFFKYFIKRLEDNDASCVSAETLYTKIKPAVIYNSPNNHIPQFGVLPQSGDEGGNFIFKRK